MNRQIFIMAQGKGSRWEEDDRTGWCPPATYKQLVSIGDETIITRTIRQFSPNDMTVIAQGEPFFPFVEGKAELITFHEPVGTLIQGIWKTSEHWKGDCQIIILLGDVIYSNAVVEEILADEYATMSTIFGRDGANLSTRKAAKEIFAFAIPSGINIQAFWKQELRAFWENNYGTKLWDFYNINYPEMEFIKIDDYTDDCDSVQEYQQFYPKLLEEALKDDKRLHEHK